VFTFNGNTNLYDGYYVSGLTQLWSISSPTANGVNCGYDNIANYLLQVSSDGKSVLFVGTDYDMNWYVASVSASTGKELPSYMDIPAPGAGYFWLTVNPKSNQALIGPGIGGAGTTAVLWNFSSTTGAGTAAGTFMGGNDVNTFGYTPEYVNGSATVGGTTVPTVTTSLYPNAVTTLNADTGAILTTYSSANTFYYPASLSPSGQDYLYGTGAAVGVFSYPAASEVASATTPGQVSVNNALSAWGGTGATTRFAIYCSSNDVLVYSFTGSKITLLATIPDDCHLFQLSADGTKIAVPVQSITGIYSVSVYNAGTGTLLFTINPDVNSHTGIDDVSFTNSSVNEIGVHEATDIYSSSSGTYTWTNEYRVFSMAKTTPTLVSKMTYTLPSNATVYSAQYCDGDLSPDGLTVAMGSNAPSSATDPRETGTVRLFSGTTGAPLLEWDNQFIPDFLNPDSNLFTPTFDFSLDGSTLIWSSQNQLIAASTSAVKVGLSLSATTVPGGTSATGTVTITPTPASATTVTLSSSSTSVTVPATVTVAANTSSATFTATTVGVAASTSAAVTATLVNSTSPATLTVTPATTVALSFSPSTVNAGTSSTGTVTLNAEAGPSGLVVSLSSANSAVVAVPASVTVPANKTSVTFTATTGQSSATGPVLVTATAGTLTGSASLTVTRTVAIEAAFNQSSITGGGAVLLTLTLSVPAPTGGTVVTLSASNSALMPRASVTIPAGATSISIGVATNPVLANTSSVLTATVTGGSVTATESVLAPLVQSVTPEVSFVVGGGSTYAVVELSGPAPAGFLLACSSGNKAVTVPASFTFPTGHATAEVPITTTAVTTATAVTVTIAGKTFTITVYP
jgi:hypothetical protein